jgi:hypothetical protein
LLGQFELILLFQLGLAILEEFKFRQFLFGIRGCLIGVGQMVTELTVLLFLLIEERN